MRKFKRKLDWNNGQEAQKSPRLEAEIEISTGLLPTRQTNGSAGYDLAATQFAQVKDRLTLDLGIKIKLPPNHCALIVPRSGLDINNNVFVPRVRVIDADYRGPVMVDLENRGSEPFDIKPGDRIAQMLVVPVPPVNWQRIEKIQDDTERGEKGFGSTGIVS